MAKIKNESRKELQRTMDVVGFQEYHRRRVEGEYSDQPHPRNNKTSKWTVRKLAAKKLLEYIRSQTNRIFQIISALCNRDK